MTGRRASFRVPEIAEGQRLDVFLARACDALTRSQAERLAKSGRVLLNGRPAPAGQRLAAGDVVEVALPAAASAQPEPEAFPLDVLFEDDQIIVVSKPSGLAVHPGAGRTSGTLVNALLAHSSSLAQGEGPHRPGIVHRLDKDTSGLLVVAKTDEAYAELSRQVRTRTLQRRYVALVWGRLQEDRLLIDVPIGRHQRERTRMAAVTHPQEGRAARPAQTDVAILERFGSMTLVEARLHTGRTHQIRVHLSYLGHPVVGDRVYGARRAKEEKAKLDGATRGLIARLPGHALHAGFLGFGHPTDGREMSFSVPLPPEMAALISHLSRQREGD